MKKPDAIVFIPVDYKALVPAVEKINAAEDPGRQHHRPYRRRQSRRLSSAPTTTTSGWQTARHLLKTMGGKGNVVILEGVKGSLTNTDRVRGFNDALKESPNVKLLAAQPGQLSAAAGAAGDGKPDAVASRRSTACWRPTTPMAVGALEALEGANRKALVIGINGSKEAVELIKSGKLLASGDFNGFIQGCLGTEIAVRHLRKEATPKEIILKPVVIDKTNYQPYETPIEQRACPKLADVATQ